MYFSKNCFILKWTDVRFKTCPVFDVSCAPPGIRLAREALPSLGPEWDVAYLTAWCMVGVGSTPSGKNMPEICKYLETDLNGPGVGTQKPKNLSKLIYDKKLEKFLTRSKICRFLLFHFWKYKIQSSHRNCSYSQIGISHMTISDDGTQVEKE